MHKRFRLAMAATASVAIAVGGGAGTVSAFSAPAMKFERIERQLLTHDESSKLLIAAHRGQWREYPENSLAAVDEAIKDGAEIIEIDVRVTKDGVPVLMHDETVDRTTNGTGRVSEMTIAEVKELRLKEGLGGDAAAITEHQIPTLEEAMAVVKGRAMVNLDKGWADRDAILAVLQDTNTVNHGIFKGGSLEEAAEFMEQHPDTHYMHIIGDGNVEDAFEFPGRQPVAYEIVFDSVDDPQAQPSYLDRVDDNARIWINTMWGSLAADNTDEASLRLDPELGWDTVVDEYRATMNQTDNVEALDFWRDGGQLKHYDRQPGQQSIRIQAEEPKNYFDIDANKCLSVSPDSPRLDICDQRGARVLGWIRGEEWVEYEFEVVIPGTYEVSARVSSPYDPAGTVLFSWDGEESVTYSVGNTTSHNAFEHQSVERRRFSKGTHTLRLDMPADEYQNFNLDYIQLDRINGQR